MRSAAPRRGLPRVVAVSLGLVAGLGVAEVGLRVLEPPPFDPPTLRDEHGEVLASLSNVVYELQASGRQERTWPNTYIHPHRVVRGCYDRPAWDYFDANGCVEYRTNAFGFRDDEFAHQPATGELRILALGDSFTFGLGVQLEDTWAQRLERGLAASTDRPVQVLNAGFAQGHMPSGYLYWLRDGGLSFGARLVILGLALNDMGDVPMLAGRGRSERSASRVIALAEDTLGVSAERLPDYGQLVRDHPGVWSSTRTALTKIAAELEQRRIRFVVAVFPMLSQLDGEYPFAELHTLAVDFCTEQGIEVVDLLPVFRGRDERALWVHPTDQHPNDVGHALIAEALLAYLGPVDGG